MTHDSEFFLFCSSMCRKSSTIPLRRPSTWAYCCPDPETLLLVQDNVLTTRRLPKKPSRFENSIIGLMCGWTYQSKLDSQSCREVLERCQIQLPRPSSRRGKHPKSYFCFMYPSRLAKPSSSRARPRLALRDCPTRLQLTNIGLNRCPQRSLDRHCPSGRQICPCCSPRCHRWS